MAGTARPLVWPLLGGLAWGCSAPQTDPAHPHDDEPPVETADSNDRPAVDSVRGPAAPPPNRFQPLGRVTFEFTKAPEGLPATFTRAELGAWQIPAPRAAGSWLALDQHPPRKVEGPSLRVKDLLNEDQELAPGAHVLVFIDEDEEGRVVSRTHAFSVDVPGGTTSEGPGCTLLSPHLTFNGPTAARAVDVLVVPLIPGVDGVELEAQGPDYASKARLEIGQRVRLEGAPSGDIELVARCFQGQKLISTAPRTITINADAPEGATP